MEGAFVERVEGSGVVYQVDEVHFSSGTFDMHPLHKPQKKLLGLLPKDFKKVQPDDPRIKVFIQSASN